MIAADLFLVDSSNPARLRAESAAIDAENPDFGAAVRHDTFLSLLAFGPGGMQFVQIDGRASAEDASRLKSVTSETGLEDVGEVISAIVVTWKPTVTWTSWFRPRTMAFVCLSIEETRTFSKSPVPCGGLLRRIRSRPWRSPTSTAIWIWMS